MPARKSDTIHVTRRIGNRVGIVEKTMIREKRLTQDEQRAQATAMMMRRLFGGKDASITGLAQEFDLVPATITKRLALARTDGVPDEARQVFIQEMLPTAMAVVQEVMAGEDRKLAFAAAKMVIDGLEAMSLPQEQQPHGTGPVIEESFEIWRQRVTRTHASVTAGPASPDASGGGTVIEAVSIPAPAPEPAPAPAASDSASPGSGSCDTSPLDGLDVSKQSRH